MSFSASLAGRRALVTGASGGPGEHFARLLARCGAHVAVAARRIEECERVCAAIRGEGGEAVAIAMDVGDSKSAVEAVGRAVSALGGLAMNIEIARLLVMKAAWELDRGGFARKEVSMAKIQAANTLHQAADIAIRINGARGYSKDTIPEWIYRYARQPRLVDGADEVHRMALDRAPSGEGPGFRRWPVAAH